jgi:multicomponent Na+:H+ antiporter subunit D
MAGLGRLMPWTMAAFVIGGLSLIGIPMTVGFVSKWYLVLAAIERGWWPVVALILVASLLALAYIWQVLERAYFQPPPARSREIREAPWSLLIPTWVLAGANLYFGLNGVLTARIANRAATLLLGGGP